MLGKLLKHELKATSRWFLPLFGVGLIMAVMARITRPMLEFEGFLQFISGSFMFIYVLSVIAIAVVSIILIVYRFYRNMVTDEGYLMHTLPVSVTSQVVSKLLISGLWTTLSIIVTIVSILIVVSHPGMFTSIFDGLQQAWQEISEYLSSSQMIFIVFELIVLTIIAIFSLPLTAYSSIAIGQLISKNKIAGAIAGYIIVSIASNVVGMLGLIPSITRSNIYFIDSTMNNFSDIFNSVNNMFLLSFLITILFNAALFFITTYIFKNKLNLE